MSKNYQQNASYGEIRRQDNEEVSTGGQDKYKLPYGLCAKYGISLPAGATPTDAWNALKGIGIKPSDVYKELQENGDTSGIKPTNEKVDETPAQTKKELDNLEENEKLNKKEEVANLSPEEKTQIVLDYIQENFGEQTWMNANKDVDYNSKFFDKLYNVNDKFIDFANDYYENHNKVGKLSDDDKYNMIVEYNKEKYPSLYEQFMNNHPKQVWVDTFDASYGDNSEFTSFVDNKLSETQSASTKSNEVVENKPEFNRAAYTEQRKNNALWYKGLGAKENSQKEYTPNAGKVWGQSSALQKASAYKYTDGSGSYNRPLRGYDKQWGKYGYKGLGKVSLDNEGKGKEIKALTEMIDKSSYDKDIWVQRGLDFDGAKQFLGIEGNITQEKINELINSKKELKDYGFCSAGASKGTGFSHENCIFNIYCPAGTKMLYCAPFSSYGGYGTSWNGKDLVGGSENEMLLQRQTGFRATKGEYVNGRWYIDIEVTSQNIDDSIYK